jgi:hypothetical protein
LTTASLSISRTSSPYDHGQALSPLTRESRYLVGRSMQEPLEKRQGQI